VVGVGVGFCVCFGMAYRPRTRPVGVTFGAGLLAPVSPGLTQGLLPGGFLNAGRRAADVGGCRERPTAAGKEANGIGEEQYLVFLGIPAKKAKGKNLPLVATDTGWSGGWCKNSQRRDRAEVPRLHRRVGRAGQAVARRPLALERRRSR